MLQMSGTLRSTGILVVTGRYQDLKLGIIVASFGTS